MLGCGYQSCGARGTDRGGLRRKTGEPADGARTRQAEHYLHLEQLVRAPVRRRLLGEFLLPTFVVWGMLDKVVPFTHGRVAVQRLRHGRSELLRCVQMPHVECPESFLSAVLGVLAGEPHPANPRQPFDGGPAGAPSTAPGSNPAGHLVPDSSGLQRIATTVARLTGIPSSPSPAAAPIWAGDLAADRCAGDPVATATPVNPAATRGQRASVDELRMTGEEQPLIEHRGSPSTTLTRLQPLLLWLADLVVPKRDLVVLRTFPDFDDQGREFLRAWRQAHPDVPVVWLVGRDRAPVPPAVRRSGVTCLPASSVAGLWAYLRANLVVHTKGLYGVPRRSRAKYFVNLWHGMPVKRLYLNAPVGRRQTDVLTVTSQVHRSNLSSTWGLPQDRIIIEGLPRGDRLVRAASEPMPKALAAEARGRRLCLWLPTYRTAMSTLEHRDGYDFGNVFQLPGATVEAVAELFAARGLHVIVKPHPIAGQQPTVSLPGLTVWNEEDLAARDLTLYQALGHAELLLTDHSSVWIDYLLLRRPVVFTIGDREDYSESRGHYFTPLEEYLPGPAVDTLEGLASVLSTSYEELVRTWAEPLASSQAFHHRFVDDRSAERIVKTVSATWRDVTRESAGDRRRTSDQLS